MPEAVDVAGEFVVGPSAFPATPVPSRIENEEAVWPDVSVEYELQYSQSWPLARALRPRQITLIYENQPDASFTTVLNHFKSVGGMEGTFPFTHPTTGEAWKARYAKDDLTPNEWKHKPDVFTWTVTLEEVPW